MRLWSTVAMVLLSLLLLGCEPRFSYAVAPSAGPTVDPADYLGEWTIDEVTGASYEELGLPSEPVAGTFTLTISNDPPEGLLATYVGEWIAETMEAPIAVTMITDTVVASLQMESDTWSIGSIHLLDGGDRLAFSSIGYSPFRDAVLAGELDGDVMEQGEEWEETRIDASSEEVLGFLLEHPEAILGPEHAFAEFVRLESVAHAPVSSEEPVVAKIDDAAPVTPDSSRMTLAFVAVVVLSAVVGMFATQAIRSRGAR